MPPTPRRSRPEQAGTEPPRSTRERRAAPSVLDLVRLSPEPVFPPGGEALYRQIALITDLKQGQELLDAACGRGLTTIFLASNYGVEAVGLDADELLVTEAEQRARAVGLETRIHFQANPLHDLPFQDDVFDVAIGEIGLGGAADPATAIRELARVTRPRGCVVLVQLVWTGNVEDARREILVQHLGTRPLLLVEWKQHLRDAGCVDLHVEDWSDQSGPFRPAVAAPFHDLARLFSVRQKVTILRRAFARWGWRGVRGAIVREQEIHRLLTRQRVLGLSMIRGTKWDRPNPDVHP
jgi:SAM-dependent methyltransferase